MKKNNFRLVILDYPKLIISDEKAKKVLADMIQAKQINFERSCQDYVPLSGLDMISTHFLIYDTTDIFEPKLILAIRNCYEDRTLRHHFSLPSEEYIKFAPEEYQKAYYEFKKNKEVLVDCNAWFVDPDYSFRRHRYSFV